jgi:hypothetical protein
MIKFDYNAMIEPVFLYKISMLPRNAGEEGKGMSREMKRMRECCRMLVYRKGTKVSIHALSK